MFSKKGKRKIVIDDKTYFWCVTADKETGIEPIWLRVFSEDKYLFETRFEYENKHWVYDSEPNPLNISTLILGEAPVITPSVVKKLILNYLSANTF